jgi:dipeptidyl aminopeptidase/acylaminoacyl peptidase
MVHKLLCIALCLVLLSCTPQPSTPAQTSLYIYRLNPPAFVEFSVDFQPSKEIPFSVPPDCSLMDVFPAPVGALLLVELGCPNGQTVLFLDTDSGAVTQPVTETDSHFLAWLTGGKEAYLKVDSLGNTRIVRSDLKGRLRNVDITGWTYDLSTMPGSSDFVFTFSRGMGSGSEMTLSQRNSRDFQQLLVDGYSYLSFARYTSDGRQIAFIKIPDSQTPFTVGELWIMNADGTQARKLADVDAGHGYAANWSPDGKWIAFVKRENAEDQGADQSADSLISNIYLVNVQSGDLKQITSLTNGRVETPHWSPDGNTLAFNTVPDGRMEVQIADIASGEIRSLISEPACCPAWMRK